MTTYRERRLRRAERLREWSATNERKSEQRGAVADEIMSYIPMGQPILVGHHSERRHRKDLERIESGIRTSFELGDKAADQARRADAIEAAAAGAIYDDDPDAIEALSAKIARMEAKRDEMKAANAEYRKTHRAELKTMTPYQRGQAVPYPSYVLQNLGGNISRCRERLVRLLREKEQGPRDRVIVARFDSECADCGEKLTKGEQIRYNRQQGARCLSCPERKD